MVTKKEAMKDFLTKPQQEELGKSEFRQTHTLTTRTVTCGETNIKHRTLSYEDHIIIGIRLNNQHTLILEPESTYSVPQDYLQKLERLAQQNNIDTTQITYRQLDKDTQVYCTTSRLKDFLQEKKLYNLLNKEQRRKYTAEHI